MKTTRGLIRCHLRITEHCKWLTSFSKAKLNDTASYYMYKLVLDMCFIQFCIKNNIRQFAGPVWAENCLIFFYHTESYEAHISYLRLCPLNFIWWFADLPETAYMYIIINIIDLPETVRFWRISVYLDSLVLQFLCLLENYMLSSASKCSQSCNKIHKCENFKCIQNFKR